jgi:hypothetical protein
MNINKYKTMKYFRSIMVIIAMIYMSESITARNPEGESKRAVTSSKASWRADCTKAQKSIDMQVNNVRARLKIGGDLWSRAQYIVPKPAPGKPAVSAIFSGGVWIGGVDQAGNTKLSAVTFGENDNDFFAGPLDLSGTTEAAICRDWDRFFVVSGINVRNHYNYATKSLASGIPMVRDSITDDVLFWPGAGNPFWRDKYTFALPTVEQLGAFWDQDDNGIYDPTAGDFPIIDIRGCAPADRMEARELIPDEMTFWIYNDNGGPQTLSGGDPIQMEVQVQAFAYATNDEINDMSFYRYKLINKASGDLVDCYFAMWIDPDLGCYTDDYIGCDVGRSMAYVYNQDAVDGFVGATCPEGVPTYGSEIPILGMDYFRGPLGPRVFKKDSEGVPILDVNGDYILLEPKPFTGEQDTVIELGMTSFTYSVNCGVGTFPNGMCDPQNGTDGGFYNLIRGFWRDSTAFTRGGSGYNPMSSDSIKYAFPDDPNDTKAEAWSMCSALQPFGDRRTLQATGPLLLQPNATNELILGVVFVPNLAYPCPDITRLKFADDIAQALFDNCFDITDGPDAPDITAVELDRELIILLSNEPTSNNFNEQYQELDLQAPTGVGVDTTYNFEGYRIYQLANPSVTAQELGDISKSRLIANIDVNNDLTEIYNWTGEPNPLSPKSGSVVWTPTRKVVGANTGVTNSIRITEDQFAKTDKKLINHKQYYFLAVAYAHNNYLPFDIVSGKGQRRAYLEGRKNVGGADNVPYTLVPRPMVYDKLNSAYGEGPQVTRISGEGNPAVFLEVDDSVRESMLATDFNGMVKYKSGLGPVNAKVVNPLIIKDGKYRLEISGDFSTQASICGYTNAKWTLSDVSTGTPIVLLQDRPLSFAKEYILNNLGFSITLRDVDDAGEVKENKYGAVGAELVYKDDAGPKWFNAVRNGGIFQTTSEGVSAAPIFNYVRNSPESELNTFGPGFFTPWINSRWEASTDPQFSLYLSPAARTSVNGQLYNAQNPAMRTRDLNNVDIVFTKDRTKWSKCVVVETSFAGLDLSGLKSIGDAKNFDMRKSLSVDQNGNPDGTGTTGMGYFPGYAVDVETGERLNVFFGENSMCADTFVKYLEGKVPLGGDMIFNPSNQLFTDPDAGLFFPVAGGQHYIYVTRMKYDGCAAIAAKLASGSTNPVNRSKALACITWTAFPIGVAGAPLLPIEQGLIPNDMIYKLRVNNPYSQTRRYNIENIRDCATAGDKPVYEFEFKGKQAQALVQEDYKGALENVNVVPNPYYAYSAYETSQFTNTIKVTNLPARAIVTIYGIDGSFIKQYNRDERGRALGGVNRPTSTSQVYPDLEWDLKNFKDIPVASGVYLIHISAPELGEERTIKWFGIGRKFDPSGL